MNSTYILGGILLLVVLTLGISFIRFPSPLATSREGAVLALSYFQEWAKWMSGIQTAALGGLALLVFQDDTKVLKSMSGPQKFFSLSAFVFLALGLFLAAWILSSLPSLAVRIYHRDSPDRHVQYDVYEQGVYGWSKVKVGYLTTAQHWFWAFGLLSLGVYVLLAFLT